MNLITALLMVTLLSIEVLTATISHLGGPYDGLPFPLEPMEFNITVDGKFIQGHGTIQQVYAQYASENPSFKMPNSLSFGSALQGCKQPSPE
ncbi:hypothetical protein DL95DRAFT_463963 [Leptodontidium sp. 2 PMI_412]|nr:hypothetical protein DL95DRAFT_463963 [Leptodontidium sp. 2 PMI_412]